MRKYLILAFLILTQISYAQKSEKSENTNTDNEPEMEYTSNRTLSLVNLIATPEKYHGKKVQIIGFLNIEFEGDGIYLHKDDYEHGIYSNGFWVSIDQKTGKTISNDKLNKSYVLIEGTFNMKQRGHMGLWSGEIENITRIIKWN
ncbi:hypothetical protein [Tenacibaculum finnmarkense]|uniref:hypothetical protein n=1 Tax=Tenacibaculum TaxID=104267 RepID=UPI00187B465D|nr:hypothetical protein [Tenacibaculum finnmarkense]MBE7646765.1 hypothetical protein [Tenacibaculum finnmarkense genomovar ulcerans]MCD8423650.1 hypothetical protein [Tenacibaculum finnmarkense genomovar ulcerans]MCD8445748.1 hypothetical protein [Tenacibaculum finnmarkense genomovar ulcerans]MCG8239799.1 hypothetical protein [Tenacibaculum finnmarkense genomovar ulcerans]MCG8734775.1 hypothetical protein [Tenacibaculum finnmarkense]